MGNDKLLTAELQANQDNTMGGKYRKAFEDGVRCAVNRLEQALEAQPTDKGEISDGYHTFNQLYHQRAILFATIVNQNKDKAWKSFKHSDGKYCFDSDGEWFIVGVDTPQGSYTYHYAKEYWDMFDCQELECGKEWDGHTEEDVTRLLSLEQQPCEDCISRAYLLNHDFIITAQNGISHRVIYATRVEEAPSVIPQIKRGQWIFNEKLGHQYCCSECGNPMPTVNDYYRAKLIGCPYCLADMREGNK